MAEFNAYPELDYHPADYNAVPMAEARLAAIRQGTQQSADEFPLLMQARQQSNEFDAMALSQAKEQNRYQQLLRATQGVDFGDSQGAGKEWDKNLQALSDSAPDEATKNFFKQYIGHGTQAQRETIGKMYDAPKPASGAKSGASGSAFGGGAANAMAQPIGLKEDQQIALSKQPPSKLQPLLGAADQALEDVKLVKNAGAEAPRVWKGLQMIHPALQSRGEYSPQLMDQLEAEATQVKQIASSVLGQQSMGIPPATGEFKAIPASDRGIVLDRDENGNPTAREVIAPTYAPQDPASNTIRMQQSGALFAEDGTPLGEGRFNPTKGDYEIKNANGEWESAPPGARQMSITTGGLLNPQQRLKLAEDVLTDKQGLDQITKYAQNVGGLNTGISRWADQIAAKAKTLFGSKELSNTQFKQLEAKAQLEGLLGAFRTEVLGPGVLTEIDAQRILRRLGGDVNSLQSPKVVQGLLSEVYQYKLNRYNLQKAELDRNSPAYGDLPTGGAPAPYLDMTGSGAAAGGGGGGQAQQVGPPVGTVVNGFTFKGGNPKVQSNWVKK